MGKKVLHVPYRDSVLTKLLQSALGGNSRTIMVTLSSCGRGEFLFILDFFQNVFSSFLPYWNFKLLLGNTSI